MGVTENKEKQRLKDISRLDYIIGRQLEIERILDESIENLIPLLAEYDNLSIEREILEKKIENK